MFWVTKRSAGIELKSTSSDLTQLFADVRRRYCDVEWIEIASSKGASRHLQQHDGHVVDIKAQHKIMAGYGPRLGQALMSKNRTNRSVTMLSLNIDLLLKSNIRTTEALAPLYLYLRSKDSRLEKLALRTDTALRHDLRRDMLLEILLSTAANTTITKLDLNDCFHGVMSSMSRVVAKVVQTTTSITNLVLNLTPYSKDAQAVCELAQAFETNTSVDHVTLVLYGNNKSGNGTPSHWSPLLQALASSTNLRGLTVEWENVCQSDFHALATMLRSTSSLRGLDIVKFTLQADTIAGSAAADLTPQLLLPALRECGSLVIVTFKDKVMKQTFESDEQWTKLWPALSSAQNEATTALMAKNFDANFQRFSMADISLCRNELPDAVVDVNMVPALWVGSLPAPRLAQHAVWTGLSCMTNNDASNGNDDKPKRRAVVLGPAVVSAKRSFPTSVKEEL